MRILFVTARPPWPPRRGDQARTAGFIAALAPRHEIRVAALVPAGFAAGAPPQGVGWRTVRTGWPAMLAAALVHPRLPLQVGLHPVRGLRRLVAAEVAAFRPDVAVVVLSRLGGVLPALVGVPVVLDYVDALELNMRNRAAREGLAAPLLRREAARMGRWDRQLLARVVRGAVVSERDRIAIAGATSARGSGSPWCRSASRCRRRSRRAAAPGEVVLLSGNLGYFPTVDGAGWFAAEVFPRLREAPARRRVVVGRRSPRCRRPRCGGARPVCACWTRPDDLAAVRRLATVAIAPMRSGSGTPSRCWRPWRAASPWSPGRRRRRGWTDARRRR